MSDNKSVALVERDAPEIGGRRAVWAQVVLSAGDKPPEAAGEQAVAPVRERRGVVRPGRDEAWKAFVQRLEPMSRGGELVAAVAPERQPEMPDATVASAPMTAFIRRQGVRGRGAGTDEGDPLIGMLESLLRRQRSVSGAVARAVARNRAAQATVLQRPVASVSSRMALRFSPARRGPAPAERAAERPVHPPTPEPVWRRRMPFLALPEAPFPPRDGELVEVVEPEPLPGATAGLTARDGELEPVD